MLYRRFLQKFTLPLLILSVVSWQSSAMPTLSTSNGIVGDFSKDDDTKDIALKLTGFFGAQVNISNNLVFRGECSIRTEDIIGSGLFNDTESSFCIDELSFTLIKPFLGSTQYISAFVGTFESVGGDTFIQRVFGIKPLTPYLAESWEGIRKPGAFSYYGSGASYIYKFGRYPGSLGAYIYVNKENEENDFQINFDTRQTLLLDWLYFDFSAGLSAPFNTKNGDEDVILLIDELFLHTGLELDIGNRYASNIYLASGFENLSLKSTEENKIESKDMYIFLEPRFVADNNSINFSFFNIPDKKLERFMLIDDSLGMNIAFITDNAYAGNFDLSIGCNCTVSYPEKDFLDLTEPMDNFQSDKWNVTITPFTDIHGKKGIVKIMFATHLKQIGSSDSERTADLYIGWKSR